MAIEQTIKNSILANLKSVLGEKEGRDRLAKYIVSDDITWVELEQTGELDTESRSALKVIVDSLKASQAEDQLWQQVQNQHSIAAYQNYLDKYPCGKYTNLAQTSIAGLIAIQNASQKYQHIQRLQNDINAYSTLELNAYGITFEDLINNGINIPDGIKDIWNDSGIDLQHGNAPDSIPKGRTEIYFWGAPGSGKTCTLAAVIGTAQRRGFYDPQTGSGLMYMNQLSNLFINGVATLPPPSPVEVTQALSFDLRDATLKSHPVTMIEISGEIFECFTYAINGMTIPDDGHLSAYQSLLKFLQSTDNPKYHFFIIDVNNTTLDCFGMTQMTYLQNAALYFKQNKIFNEKTAGINILVTKSDLLTPNKSERSNAAVQILKNRYVNFVNSLKTIAYEHHLINKLNDMIPVIPFTLGEVYLKDKCLFDPEMSDEIIRILQENVAMKHKPQKIGSWLNR